MNASAREPRVVPTTAQAVEIGLVEDHRVYRDQFLALQTVDNKPGRSVN
jgi:hypothetical protein